MKTSQNLETAVLHRGDLVALHARLQRADRVDLGHVHDGGLRGHRGGGALADVAEAADDDLLAREHDVGRAHDAVGQRVAAAVDVVELRLGHAVVDVDRREEELALLRHLDEAVDAGGGLLGDADHALDHAREARLVLLDRGLDRREHALELGVVGRRRRRAASRPWRRLDLELLALVEEQGGVTAVVDDLVHALAVRPGDGLVRAPPVLLERLALPREDVRRARAHDGRRGNE